MSSKAAPIDPQVLQGSLAEFRQSYTLPGVAYTSPDLFAWEMREFFEPSWVCFGRTEGLMRPGTRCAVKVGDESILLTRDDAGTLRGFFNICRHRGHELLPVGASAEGPWIQCPYHGWTYKQDGSLKSAPELGLRPGFQVGEHRLTSVRVDEWEGWAFVNVSGDARPLKEHLGNLAEIIGVWAPRDMVEVSRMDYVVEANWKILHENYQECYHCSEIHPELCRVSPPTSGLSAVAEGDGFDGSYAAEFWDVTNRQDWAACESVQRSAASRGFKPGPISEMEESVFQFLNMIATGYVDGRISPPKNPTLLAKPKR